MKKHCNKCGKTKSRSCFAKNPCKHDGVESLCKLCKLRYSKEHYKTKKNYYDTYYLNRLYGITEDEYNRMFTEQRGHCKLCGVHQSQLKQRLCVDHNHNTGKVRGLLCHNCNSAIGLLHEDIDLISRLKDYLQ